MLGHARRGQDRASLRGCGASPDLGISLAAEAAARVGEHLVEVDVESRIVEQPMPPRPSDILSGGSLQSIVAVADDPEIDCIVDPGCLVCDPATAQAVRVRSPIRVRPRYRDGAVIAPMSPAAFTARERLKPWRWRMSIRARTSTGRAVRVEINADGHPLYWTTPRMLAEAGLLLSEAGSAPERSGCLTPSTALGTGSAGALYASRAAILARLGTQPPRLGGSS